MYCMSMPHKITVPVPKTPAALTLSKVARSNSITSLFIEEITTPESSNLERTNNNNNCDKMVSAPCGSRKTWTPQNDINCQVDNSISPGESAVRSSSFWIKFLCWFLVVFILISFVGLIFIVAMSPSTHNLPTPNSDEMIQGHQVFLQNLEEKTNVHARNDKLEKTSIDIESTENTKISKPKRMTSQLQVETNTFAVKTDKINTYCFSGSFLCNRNNSQNECVNYKLVCDGHMDCKNGMDEVGCVNVSYSLNRFEPVIKMDSIEGYVLVRFRGVWHPYCSNNWSEHMGQQICKYLGYQILDSWDWFALGDLTFEKVDPDEFVDGTRLMVALSQDDTESESFQIVDLNSSIEDPWSLCKIGHLRCTGVL